MRRTGATVPGVPATATTTTAATATALAASLLLAGCTSSGTGVRDEGPARTPVGPAASAPPAATASPSASPRRIDPVRLVLEDPKVSPDVKLGFKPCTATAKGYPVDVSYGRLTGTGANDVVVNVMTCESVGVGAYVYRVDDGRYENVFQDEEFPVYAAIDHRDLVVTEKIYAEGDTVTYPSSEDVITYRWSPPDGRFMEEDRTHNDYGNAAGDGKIPTMEN